MPLAYLLHFLAGAILANGVPHFVHGISGEKFQSPFAHPPGKGLSSPLVNVLWGFGNLVAGTALLMAYAGPRGLIDFTAVGLGALAMGVALAIHFGRVKGNQP
ncbi:MAG TPA: hypothetical protein VGT78_02590 [Rhizomicrobium sp.]|nr:hypothetical protein [Rhizomicrobium sp.]